jgi:hypothetical protein
LPAAPRRVKSSNKRPAFTWAATPAKAGFNYGGT